MPTLVALSGFDYRSFKGLTAGLAGNRIFDEAVIPAGSSWLLGRMGTSMASEDPYFGSSTALKLVMSSNVGYVRWTQDTFGVVSVVVTSIWLKVDSGSGTFTVFHVDSAAANARVNVNYNAATGQVTLAMPGEGTSQTAAATVALGEWFRIDLRVDYSGNKVADQYLADWQLDGVAQDRVASGTGKTPTTVGYVGPSDPTSKTATLQVDDWVLSVTPKDYPLGSYAMVGLVPSELYFLVLSGTASNWGIFYDGALDGSPPTIEPFDASWAWTLADIGGVIASPDKGNTAGVVQTAAAASDYVEITVLPYVLKLGEVVGGARFVAYGWAQDANPANIEVRLWNGVNERVLYARDDPNFDASTTNPATIARMIPVADLGTQDKLNHVRPRIGWSTDATPPIGIHFLHIDLAIRSG